MMTSKKFVFLFLGTLFLLLTTIGIFNRVVDPFWYYRDIEIDGFNAIKTKFRRYERDIKPSLLVREQPEAIILGSSFSEIGFDANNPYFNNNGQLKSMNFALAGASWQMVQCEFEFAATHTHLKRVLIGIHPEAMPISDCAKDFSTIGQINTGELLLSNRALMASVQTVNEQKNANPSHTRTGMYFYIRGDRGVDKQFNVFFSHKTKSNPQCSQVADTAFHPPATLANPHLDLSGLQHLIEVAQQHHIELVLFFYPRHAYSLELDQQCGNQEMRWQAMKQISELNEQYTNGKVSIWQFYDYNSITAEPIGGAAATYWQDPEHFNFEMGDLMLADIFANTDNMPKLGRLINSKHIDEDYQNFLHNRITYLQQHPEFQTNLQKLLIHTAQ